MSCESLTSLLAAIDQAIAYHGASENNQYLDYWRKQTDVYRRQTDDINRQISDLQKQRIRENGGFTRGVRG